jgi:hypothetical protein
LNNKWAVLSVVLAVLLVVSLGFFIFDGSISEKTAGNIVMAFATEQGVSAELVSIEKESSLFLVTLDIDGQEVPVYLTEDGNNLVPSIIPITPTEAAPSQPAAPEPTNVPKSDKPEVELYVWSYCPYGVLAQGPLAEVASLLGDSAEFTIVPYYDGHGAYENQQNKIQSCIQELSPDKYWAYAAGFVSDIYPACSSQRTEECDLTESVKLMTSLGIDSTGVMSCVTSDGDALYAAASSQAQQNGVQGSPTVIVNGVKLNVARNAEAYKTAICSAYNDSPSECGEVLDSTAVAAAGNC